jgi:hypothetical protein
LPHPASALHARSSRTVAAKTRRRDTIVCYGPSRILYVSTNEPVGSVLALW